MSEAARIPCPVCGEQIMPAARICRFCGERFRDDPPPEHEGDTTGGIIPYKNMPALIAYYCGVFAVIPCFPIGMAGVVLGIKGLKLAKAHPEVRGKAHAWIGIIAGGFFGLLWIGLTVMGIVVAVVQER